MSGWDVDRAVRTLLDAEWSRVDRAPITDEWPELDVDTAYRIQDELVARKPSPVNTSSG
jgi:2-oxo-3-hexenedioate decarboxylase